MAEKVGDRMVLTAGLAGHSVPNSTLSKLRIQVAEDPKRNILWDVADGQYRPVWRGFRDLEEANLTGPADYAKVADGVSRIGWTLENSGDESPFTLVNSEGEKFPLDHDAYTNTYSIDVSHGGGIIATGGEDKVARIWRLIGRAVRPGSIMLHHKSVGLVRLSDDGKLLLSATGGPNYRAQPSELRLWDTASGELLAGPWPTIGNAKECIFSNGSSVVRCVVTADGADTPYHMAAWPIGGPNSGSEIGSFLIRLAQELLPGGPAFKSGHYLEIFAMADLAEAIGGWRLTNERALVSLSLTDRLATIEHCRTLAQDGKASQLREFVHWFLADRGARRSPSELPNG
jgi:WD40 repeat protein